MPVLEAVAPKESEGVGVMEVVRLMLDVNEGVCGVRLGLGVGVWEGAVDREKLGELKVSVIPDGLRSVMAAR